MANIVCGNGRLFTKDGKVATIGVLLPEIQQLSGRGSEWSLLEPWSGTIEFNTVNMTKGFRRSLKVRDPQIKEYSKHARRHKWKKLTCF